MNKSVGNIPHHTRILIYGHHHAGGGATNFMPSNTPIYKKGGSTHRKHRHRHAEGDTVEDDNLNGINPITGTRSPDILARKKGGRACHAEGDVVATPYKHGGKTHRHKKNRRHHAEGEGVTNNIRSFMAKTPIEKAVLSRTLERKKGGSAHHHHKRKRSGREHHSFGEDVGSFLLNMAPMMLPLLLKEGGPAEQKLAAGGVGKIRKGMMTKSGKIIDAPHRGKKFPLR